MNKHLLFFFFALVSISTKAQVTQINSNKSLQPTYPLTASKAIYVSDIDSSIWITDGTLAGTIQIATPVKFIDAVGATAFSNGTLLFEGTTPATGAELYITDGTAAGTKLVSDINPGAASSHPSGDAVVLNNIIYFFAETAAEGRELWKTDGTPGGTSLVKDIVPGATGSTNQGNSEIFSNGSYLLFAANSAATGIELWKSDGTNAGTVLLKEINAGAASSSPNGFYAYNGVVLFYATDAATGAELWKTDGTTGGTSLLKDINVGAGSSSVSGLPIGYGSYLVFNSKAYFVANSGTGPALWVTDGTTVGTVLIKDPAVGGAFGAVLLADAVTLNSKFIFPVYSLLGNRNELWESDGTAGGTQVFKSFDGGQFPLICVPINLSGNGLNPSQSLFRGNKFFFVAKTIADGNELYISDGTLANTTIVKDINPGAADGIDFSNFSYTYAANTFFFPATNGTNGIELWRSDGTTGGTSMVADIVTGTGTSSPQLNFFVINNKVLFTANNGDDPVLTDLYAVDGSFTPLPVKLTDFTVKRSSADAILNWNTAQEINTRNFTVQRSFDGLNFESIGTVQANGSSTNGKAYAFKDAGVADRGKSVIYYRLLTNDADGKSSFSSIITLRITGSGKWNVKVLNDFSTDINLLVTDLSKPVQFSVLDMHGRKLLTTNYGAVNGKISIPATGLAHGNYVLIAETADERKVMQFAK